MTKQEFIDALRKKLSGLPDREVEERLNFYGEMIDDLIEEGREEADAVADFGSVDEIAERIIADIPLAKIAKERIKPKRRLKGWEITLIAIGSPIWFSLAVAAVAVVFSLYVVLWSVIVSIWAVFVSLSASALGVGVAGSALALVGFAPAGAAMIGAALVCAGLAIFSFFGCIASTKGILILTRKIALGIKNCFIGKESVK